MFRYVSLGAGQMSTALALIEKYDMAIFADTQCEYPETYIHLGFLRQKLDERGIPLVVVSAGNLVNDYTKNGIMPNKRYRYCTDQYKIRPIRRFLKSIGIKKAEVLIGFGYEEDNRLFKSDVKWISNLFPLFEKRITRSIAQKICKQKLGYIPPRSHCYACCFAKQSELSELKVNYPYLYDKVMILRDTVYDGPSLFDYFRGLKKEKYGICSKCVAK